MSAVRTWWVGRDVYGDKDELYFCTFHWMILLLSCLSLLMSLSLQGEEQYL